MNMEIVKIESMGEDIWVRNLGDAEMALTGLSDAAKLLRVHINTVRRWADKGIIETMILPTGVRRLSLNSVVSVHNEMFEIDQEDRAD